MTTAHPPIEPTPASFSTQTERDDRYRVTVLGELDVATSPGLRSEMHSLVERGAKTITVDLAGTTFIDSSGLGVLVGALKRLRESGGETIVLAGMQDQVRKVFEITGLTTLFAIAA